MAESPKNSVRVTDLDISTPIDIQTTVGKKTLLIIQI